MEDIQHMSNNSENRKDEGLKSLGAKTRYADDYAPEVLETFANKHPDNDYWVSSRRCAQ
jgi:7-cyano-7-deazaguanine reductase